MGTQNIKTPDGEIDWLGVDDIVEMKFNFFDVEKAVAQLKRASVHYPDKTLIIITTSPVGRLQIPSALKRNVLLPLFGLSSRYDPTIFAKYLDPAAVLNAFIDEGGKVYIVNKR